MGKDVQLHRQPGCWLRSSHTFKECVIAHWSSDCAPKMSGAKTHHRSFGLKFMNTELMWKRKGRNRFANFNRKKRKKKFARRNFRG